MDENGKEYQFNSEHFGQLTQTTLDNLPNNEQNDVKFRINQISYQLGINIPV